MNKSVSDWLKRNVSKHTAKNVLWIGHERSQINYDHKVQTILRIADYLTKYKNVTFSVPYNTP